MGGIHPRDKRPVGERLAQAAAATVYGLAGAAASGPTIAGCTHARGAPSLTLRFNRTLLGAGDAVAVGKYGPVAGAATVSSSMQMLVNASFWCSDTRLNATNNVWYCAEAGAPNGGACGGDVVCGADSVSPPRAAPNGAATAAVWVYVDIAAGSAPSEVVVDLAKLNGSVPFAVRYAWGNDGGLDGCCVSDSNIKNSAKYGCPVASCPLKSTKAKLPANPFIAVLGQDGTCKCVPPQVCDA